MAANPTGLSPSSIATSLALWLDASDSSNFTFSGSNLITWLDRSGNSNTFVRKSSAYPSLSNINNVQALYLASNGTLVNSNIGISSTYSLFTVANRPAGSSYQYIAKFNAVSDGYLFFGVNSGNFATFAGNGSTTWWDLNANSPTFAIGTSPVLVEAVNSGSLLTPYTNGSAQTAKVGTTIATTGIILGTTFNDSQQWLGNVGEFLLYNKPLSTSEQQQVEGYLAWKWGLNTSLPSTHPYRFFPFAATTESTPRTIPSTAFLVPVNTYSTIKTITLPTVSSNPGRLLILKDYLGYASINNIRVSSTGLDRIERTSTTSIVLSNSYGAWSFMNDGLTKWFLTDAYLNSFYFFSPPPSYVTSGLIYFLDAGNPSSYPGSGSTWTDLMGSGKNMTLFGSPAYSSANGGYLTFVPASSQYGQSASGFGTLLRFSIEVWHYYTGTNTGQFPCLVSEVWPGTTANLNFVFGNYPNTSALYINYYINAGWQSSAGTVLASNAWYHLVGMYSGSNLEIYVNGVNVVTTANSQTPNSSTDAFRIMRRWDSGDYWGGRIGIYRMYNRALTASEVAQNFANARARFGL